MTAFAYNGFDRSGRATNGLIDAPDLKSARAQLAKRGVLAETIGPASAVSAKSFQRPRHLSKPSDRSVLYQELAALLRAGIPLAQALGLLLESPGQRQARHALAAIRDHIRDGHGLSAALSACLPCMLAYEAPILEAGERSGALDQTLERLSVFLEEQARLREQVLTAMVYPCFVLALALAIAVGALGFAFPRIAAIMQEGRETTLPVLTRAIMAAGQVLKYLAPAMLLVFGGGLIWFRARASHAFKMRLDRLLFDVPVLGQSKAVLAAARFSRTLALLLHGGVPLVEALPVAGRATGSMWLAHETAETAIAVEHGLALAPGLRRVPMLSDHIGHWIETGEASGTLADTLEQAGERLQAQWQRRSAQILAFIEPALILAVGLFVFVLVLAILLPILSLNAVPQ